MSTNYTRCDYIPDGGLQCENWIPNTVGLPQKCPLHLGLVSASSASNNENKSSYIEVRNNEAKLCYEMDLVQLDEHIRNLEQVIETEKARAYSARAVRADKLDKLSDEERQVRRELHKQMQANKAQESKEPKIKKVTLASDPIKFFMQTYKITEAEAKIKLGLD